jgi:hypothetical protein
LPRRRQDLKQVKFVLIAVALLDDLRCGSKVGGAPPRVGIGASGVRGDAAYYNSVRTYRSLNKDAPEFRPVQRTRVISSRVIPGGLHHYYAGA